MTLLQPCAECGEPAAGTRCHAHTVDHRAYTRAPEVKASTRARGYGTAWRKLSERARRLQPFCTDCGRRDDLTVDHTPEAWERYNTGKAVRLSDVAVVCRACNARRGRARPPTDGSDPGEDTPARGTSTRLGEAKFRTHTASDVGGVEGLVGQETFEDVLSVGLVDVADADPEARTIGECLAIVRGDSDGAVSEKLVLTNELRVKGTFSAFVDVYRRGDPESHGVIVP